eukprot:TRINITY_DN16163_c0_g1_i1.p3 TRINITY_DN16163_c0_g1~~TRINITY_DN16163_c0_g1_i1.p3  ORF type:complete len:55 (-),score=7.38 TRINITY_DN16163_c0_g1_i1:67-231(-)
MPFSDFLSSETMVGAEGIMCKTESGEWNAGCGKTGVEKSESLRGWCNRRAKSAT